MILLLIALGGAAGSVLRYLVGGAVQHLSPCGFPVGTLVVNVVGCGCGPCSECLECPVILPAGPTCFPMTTKALTDRHL